MIFKNQKNVFSLMLCHQISSADAALIREMAIFLSILCQGHVMIIIYYYLMHEILQSTALCLDTNLKCCENMWIVHIHLAI